MDSKKFKELVERGIIIYFHNGPNGVMALSRRHGSRLPDDIFEMSGCLVIQYDDGVVQVMCRSLDDATRLFGPGGVAGALGYGYGATQWGSDRAVSKERFFEIALTLAEKEEEEKND